MTENTLVNFQVKNLFLLELYLIAFYLVYATFTHVIICDVLHDLVPFVQFKKREKQPWRSVTFSKVAGF